MSSPRILVVLVACLAVFAGCRGGCRGGDKPISTAPVTGPNDGLPRDLQPLPEPPKVELPPGSPSGGPLRVVAARPMGEFRGEVLPTVTFSKPIKALGGLDEQLDGDAKRPVARIEPAIEGEWRWLGSTSVEFVPKGQVPYATSYTVTVPKGLRALDGTELKDDYTFSFNTPKPELQDVSPERGYRWLRPDQTFKLLFNQPIAEKELAAAITFQLASDPTPIKAKVLSRKSIADERQEEIDKAVKEGRRPPQAGNSPSGTQNLQTRYEIAAEKPFPLNAQVIIKIAGTLKGELGPLPMGKDEKLVFSTFGPLRLVSARMCSSQTHCPYGPMLVFTSNEVDVASLKGKVTITPAVEIDWNRVEAWAPQSYYERDHPPHVALPGRFKPGTTYKVSIDPGVQDVHKQLTDTPFTAQARTDDLEPLVRTGGSLAVIEASSGPRLPVDVVNVKSLDVSLWKLTLPEAAVALSKPMWGDQPLITRPADAIDHTPLRYKWNEQRTHPIDLGRVFGASKTGIAIATVSSPDVGKDHPRTQRVVAQVTDLAVHLKIGPRRSLAYVTRLSTAAPVQGAALVAYSASGEQIWAGQTAADGLADMPGTVELKLPSPENAWEIPFLMVAATKDADTAITADTWSSGVSPGSFGLEQGWEGEAPHSTGYVFTDRGIYRPGDKVYIKGVARFRQVGELKAPASGSSLGLVVTNSRGDKIKNTTVQLTRYGTFSIAVDIPKDSPTGYFGVEAGGQTEGGALSFSGTFRVEEYRAPQFKVEVRPDKPELIAGDELSAQVVARYLFGGAMNDAKVKWSVNTQTTTFAPKGLEGFTFDQETWWWDDSQPRPTGGFFASGEGQVDAAGTFPVKAGKVQAEAEKTWTYTLEAEVEDVNRQAVAARTAITVHPAAFYVGLRAPSGFPEAGKELQVDAVVTDTQGKRVGGRKVEVTFLTRSWKSIRQKEAGGGFTTLSEPVEEKVDSCTLKSDADSSAACKIKPKTAGLYVVRATVTDDEKRKQTASVMMYVLGPGFVAWQRNDTDRIELVPDKTTYDVGDTARVLIKSPYPKAQGLLTVEREGVLERRVLSLEGSVTTVEVPVTEDMIPNVFVGVLLLRPRVAEGGIETGDDPGRPAARVGLVKLPVERKSKRLAVTVTTDRPEYQPGQEVSVGVELKDQRGRPAAAEVTLYAVDEAVLSLTGYETPDPINSIFPDRPLSVQLGEPLLHLVRRRMYGEKGEPAGGGGGEGEGKGLRTQFKVTAYYNPSVEVGADGKAQAKFKLPDNLTTFRIMAVAVTAGDRFGSGDTSIKVNKPLLVLPALPRFARVGDKFEAGVVVHTYGSKPGAPGEVTITASVEGAKLLGPAQSKVTVTDGTPREVRFPFTVEKPGTAVFRFRAQRGADQDGVEERIPVELPAALEAVAVHGDTTDHQVEGLDIPESFTPGMGGLNISLASTSLASLQQGMEQLVDYPYGCLEQQASRLVPFVALREIAGQFGMPWTPQDKKKGEEQRNVNALLQSFLFPTLDVTRVENPDEVVAATVRSILRLQQPDGSFRYWSDASCSQAWVSAYAALALSRARQVGYDVDPERLLRAEGYLAKVAGGQCRPCEECDPESRLFATWVLARMGRPRPSFYGELYAMRDKLPLFSKALLADAMFIGGGDRAKAKSLLLEEVFNAARETPQGVHFEETHGATYAALWHSDVRTTGAVLQTLTDVDPNHPYVGKIARYLTQVRRGDGTWRSTQEAAFSLMGLAEVVRTKERDVPDFIGRVLLEDKPLMQQVFKGRSMDVQSNSWGIDALAAARGQQLTFSKDGKGVLYYSALLRYAPKVIPKNALDRGLIVQRWFEPFSGGGQTTKFYAGDLVRVRVRVATNQERHWTAFDVPLPAGLEPVDTSLATSARQSRSAGGQGLEPGYEYENAQDQVSGSAAGGRDYEQWANAFWSPFNHVEQRDSRVVLFADDLPPGVHVASFVARATTPGTFALQPARGELMYEPEVFGRSEGGSFEVVLPPMVTSR